MRRMMMTIISRLWQREQTVDVMELLLLCCKFYMCTSKSPAPLVLETGVVTICAGPWV